MHVNRRRKLQRGCPAPELTMLIDGTLINTINVPIEEPVVPHSILNVESSAPSFRLPTVLTIHSNMTSELGSVNILQKKGFDSRKLHVRKSLLVFFFQPRYHVTIEINFMLTFFVVNLRTIVSNEAQ